MEVHFGVAGIPLTCKGRTLKDSIDDVHALELEAMEVQLFRFPIFERDDRFKLGILARELEVELSVHAPYYMDFFGTPEARERSMENIKESFLIAHELQASPVVTHLGLYNDKTPTQALKEAIKVTSELVAYAEEKGYKCKLGIETSGREKLFGSLEEVMMLVEEVPELVPVINFGHIHAREEGILRKKLAFQRIFDQVLEVTGSNNFYTHFSGVSHQDGNKIKDTPIKKSDIKFDALAKCLFDNQDFEVTIISSSPLLEHDAQYMQLVMDRYAKRYERKKKLEEEKAKIQEVQEKKNVSDPDKIESEEGAGEEKPAKKEKEVKDEKKGTSEKKPASKNKTSVKKPAAKKSTAKKSAKKPPKKKTKTKKSQPKKKSPSKKK